MTELNDALENVVVVKNYLYSQGDNWYADLLDEAADAIRRAMETPNMVVSVTQNGNNCTHINNVGTLNL